MTPEERELLIETAKAVGSLSELCRKGANWAEFGALCQAIRERVDPIVHRLTSKTSVSTQS